MTNAERILTPSEITNSPYPFSRDVSLREWKLNGVLHRLDGPAKVYLISGIVMSEWWYYEGTIHRMNDPAIVWRYKNGNLKLEEYYYKGLAHREGGPAKIFYTKTGEVVVQEHWLDDKLV